MRWRNGAPSSSCRRAARPQGFGFVAVRLMEGAGRTPRRQAHPLMPLSLCDDAMGRHRNGGASGHFPRCKNNDGPKAEIDPHQCAPAAICDARNVNSQMRAHTFGGRPGRAEVYCASARLRLCGRELSQPRCTIAHLPLRRDPQLREHEARRIYVREGCPSRRRMSIIPDARRPSSSAWRYRVRPYGRSASAR